MSLRHILQRSFVLTNMMRGGGHGWQRPDVPLSPTYVDRRKVSHRMEDINYIWIDAVQPEHTLSDNENYLLQKGRGGQKTKRAYYYVFSTGFALGLLFFLLVSYRKQKTIDSNYIEGERAYSKQIGAQRSIHKALANNPFGFDVPFNKWFVQQEYDKYLEKQEEKLKISKQIASEASQYIKRKLDEAKTQVQKGNHHDHH